MTVLCYEETVQEVTNIACARHIPVPTAKPALDNLHLNVNIVYNTVALSNSAGLGEQLQIWQLCPQDAWFHPSPIDAGMQGAYHFIIRTLLLWPTLRLVLLEAACRSICITLTNLQHLP